MGIPKWVVRIANEITNLALLVGIPRPPYTEETRLSLKQSAIGRANDAVSPWGISTMAAISSSSWRMASALTGSEMPSRTTLASGFTFEVHGTKARLRILDADPDRYLSRMNRVHAAFVPVESTTPAVVEIVPE